MFKTKLGFKKPLVGLLRMRNEALILADTLNHLSEFCDYIYIYDDASNDTSPEIYKNCKHVTDWIRNEFWHPNQSRIQGHQRANLYDYAKFKHPDSNFIYVDADERFDINWEEWDGESAVIMNLGDARMSENDNKAFEFGDKLMNFRKYFDTLKREIPFIFNANARYIGVACERYPQLDQTQNVQNIGFVQHYGKSLSQDHWQETCDYYAKNLPEYAEKWEARKKESGIANAIDCVTWEEFKKL
jgi:hypothetical protein